MHLAACPPDLLPVKRASGYTWCELFEQQHVCQPQQRVRGQVVRSPARCVRVVDERISCALPRAERRECLVLFLVWLLDAHRHDPSQVLAVLVGVIAAGELVQL